MQHAHCGGQTAHDIQGCNAMQHEQHKHGRVKYTYMLTHGVLQGRLGQATALPISLASWTSPCSRRANSCQLPLLPSSCSIAGVKANTFSSVQLSEAHAVYRTSPLARSAKSQSYWPRAIGTTYLLIGVSAVGL